MFYNKTGNFCSISFKIRVKVTINILDRMVLFCGVTEISGIRFMPAVKRRGRAGLAPAGAPGGCSLDCVPEA